MAGIVRRSDGSEILAYNCPDFPVRAGAWRLSGYASYMAECHWHPDFEVFVADDNDCDYYVNGQTVHLARGDGILVNGGRLHYGFSAAHQECSYRYAVFHPLIFDGTAPIAAAIDRLTADNSNDWWRFTAQDAAAHAAINCMCGFTGAEDAFLFQAAAAQLLHLAIQRNTTSGTADPDWAVLRRMTVHIQRHYTGHVLLADIAAAGNVCRSRCCAIFREKLHTTPNLYLTHYRLARASELIRAGSSITEAALSSGFNSASYFSEAFTRCYGASPRRLLSAGM